MKQKLITKFQNWKKKIQNIILKRYLAICLNKISTNFVAKKAKMFKLKEILKFFLLLPEFRRWRHLWESGWSSQMQALY